MCDSRPENDPSMHDKGLDEILALTQKKYKLGEITSHKYSVHSRHNWCRFCKAPALAHAEEE